MRSYAKHPLLGVKLAKQDGSWQPKALAVAYFFADSSSRQTGKIFRKNSDSPLTNLTPIKLKKSDMKNAPYFLVVIISIVNAALFTLATAGEVIEKSSVNQNEVINTSTSNFSQLAAVIPLQSEGDLHLGVASCAGSNCHGATRPYLNSTVVQNEYSIWSRDDKHSKAYTVLLGSRSKRIAKNLGLSKSAENSKICLDCHADNIPEASRGKRFDISDGVGCELCHGGGNRYLGPHVSGEVTHAQNVSLGMYPTENPEMRAKLCIQCHVGDDKRFANHKIMGAGHPRISFELDTFTEVYKHYQVDADYIRRKVAASHVLVWATGQLKASERILELYLNKKHQSNGLMPELSYYDCQACHHSTDEQSNATSETRPSNESKKSSSKLVWESRQLSGKIGPGVVRFNDSGLVMSAIIADLISKEKGDAFRKQIIAMHEASEKDVRSMHDHLSNLITALQSLDAHIKEQVFTIVDLKRLLSVIINRSSENDYYSYASAEQAVMAIEAISATLQSLGDNVITTNDMNLLRSSTISLDTYRPELFKESLLSLSAK